jgi:hypothetical protein
MEARLEETTENIAVMKQIADLGWGVNVHRRHRDCYELRVVPSLENTWRNPFIMRTAGLNIEASDLIYILEEICDAVHAKHGEGGVPL